MKLLALVTALALPALALADTPAPGTAKTKTTAPATAKMADEDVKLVAHIHAVNEMEISMGKIAKSKGSAAVKKYGDELLTDHTNGDKDLTAFAKTKGLNKIPSDTPPTEAAKKEQAEMNTKIADLMKMKAGAEFDKQFLNMMVMGHDTEIARLDAAIPMIKDVDLSSKMKDLKPVLQRHADTARELQKSAPTASAEPMKPMPATAKK
jgi:putative membrane protein